MKQDTLLSSAVIFLGIVVLVTSLAYLLSGKMVPGLIPFSSALLMVPMILIWRKRDEKWIPILFAAGGILNLIAGVMQIVQAIS